MEAKVEKVAKEEKEATEEKVEKEEKVEMEEKAETPQLKLQLILMKNQLTQPNVLLPTKVDVNAEMNPTVSPLTLSGNLMFKDALRFTNPWTEQEKSFQLSLLLTAMLLTSCLVSKESVPFPVATRQLPGMGLPGLVSPLPTVTGNLAMTMSSMMRNLCLALMKTVRILPMSGKS